ncbi:hypothetical protein DES53_11595 [Roseimicrobium gellanilyticum]|uniref:Uncharacterized protein n=1 Tax=Roseimicrobium gellanilyticum TaxID=748857 RepID=A0A366H4L2_9BACT|nr:hypothetical protein [Roseimicrobium gellanilyticum]RBP36954.1 hypothetical protein DES53_11595 [Roseimicrobium gellanilyticum]
MSRRAKFLLTVVVVALLGVLAVGLSWSWTPADPLRFSVAPDQVSPLPREHLRGIEYQKVEVLVENTSGVEVVFFGAQVSSDRSLYILPGTGWTSGAGSTPQPEERVVPPHGTVRCIMALAPELTYDSLREHQRAIHYQWTTKARRRLQAPSQWVYQHAPGALKEKLSYPIILMTRTHVAAP